MDDVRAKLATELMPAEWAMLRMLYRRDGLFIVTAELELLDVATAVATNDRAAVEGWIADGSIARPTPEQVEAWEAETGPRFLSVIVQPFVLAQRLADAG
ncbi:MAG: DUF2288 family protein [Myxococcales bacterium]|nr:DUF2288 family protein [Myxococcales bacterium]